MRALLALLILLAPSVARAGNGDGILLGNEAAMTGGAVTAMVSDGSATWYNPAGLAGMGRDAVDVSGSAFQIRAAEESGLISSTTGETNDGGYLELLSIPSASTIARRLEPGLVIAFGIFAPRFSQHTTRTSLNAGMMPTTANWTLSSTEFSATYHAGGALGFRITDNFRFGVSIFGVYREISESRQSSGTFSGIDETRIIARGGINQIRSLGAEIGFGFQWDPHENVTIAMSFRTPGLEVITQSRTTQSELDVTTRDGDPDSIDFTPTDSEELASGFAVLDGGRLALAIGHRFENWWVSGEIDVRPPLDFPNVIERRFVWNVRLGARYQVDRQLGIGGGLFTDHSDRAPIAELGETRVDFYGLSLGFEWRTPHELGENERADSLIFSTTAAIRYAYGVGEVGGLRFDPQRGTARDTVVIDTSIHEIGLHIGSALYF